jgi:hypothetical protein
VKLWEQDIKVKQAPAGATENQVTSFAPYRGFIFCFDSIPTTAVVGYYRSLLRSLKDGSETPTSQDDRLTIFISFLCVSSMTENRILKTRRRELSAT